MENNEQNDFFKEDMPMPDMEKVPELKEPQRKRNTPLTLGVIFTIIGAIVFCFYLFYMLTIGQSVHSGESSGVWAIFILPIAIIIGMAACVLNLVGLINSTFAIRSDIPSVKRWGIVLTIIDALLIVAAFAIFFLLMYTL